MHISHNVVFWVRGSQNPPVDEYGVWFLQDGPRGPETSAGDFFLCDLAICCLFLRLLAVLLIPSLSFCSKAQRQLELSDISDVPRFPPVQVRPALLCVSCVTSCSQALPLLSVSAAFQSLCQELEAKFYEGTFSWENVKQHDAASLLKHFIRELPQPLLTVEYLKAFQDVQSE